ncbi:GRIP and coiled-coil domain-containing protein-like isoform X3 [Bombus huntii]|uniref:GRIP and coiled-coil domain-containing protein-like isoform X3 n=1 Tax=Bombus huntii TaxID=85661 RepID=UPI0021A996AB|nr:GRIP and coiled-coil domain-containing protein-like isoform X3 [Bombus huntii]
MYNISTRLDALNRQLLIISKLQKMDGECSVYPTTACKKCNVYNNIAKYYHCAHKILSSKDQCSRFDCTEECISHDSIKKRIPCNVITCKTRKKLRFYKKVPSTEVHTDLKDEVNIMNDAIGKELKEPEKQSKSDQVDLTSQFYKMCTQDKIIDTYEEKSEQTIPTKDNFRTELNINSLDSNYVQNEATKQETFQIEIDESISNELGKIDSIIEDICAKDKKIFERIQKQQVIEVAHKNTDLLQERDNLKSKLQSLSEDESKRCEEVKKEVNRMKHAVKEKENALNRERAEFMDMILELTNVINIQKRRICEVSGICNSQLHSIHERNEELSQKNIEISEMKNMLQSSNSTFKEMEEKIDHLQYCLCKETTTCNQLKQELETFKENHLSELRIKDKIIEEQNKTISKQKKLLHDSEVMVQQVASEFNELKDELNKEKTKNESLQITLNENDTKLSKIYLSQCEKCRTLIVEIDYLKKEKQKAIALAKFAYQKLHQSVKEYKKRLICEKQQHRYMALIIEEREHEIGCLRNQICQNNMRII